MQPVDVLMTVVCSALPEDRPDAPQRGATLRGLNGSANDGADVVEAEGRRPPSAGGAPGAARTPSRSALYGSRCRWTTVARPAVGLRPDGVDADQRRLSVCGAVFAVRPVHVGTAVCRTAVVGSA